MRFAFSAFAASDGPETDEWMMEAEIRLALLADELGFDMVVVGERHFTGLVGGNPLLSAAALAGRLTNAWIGTGVVVVPNYHPVRLAEMLNIIDHLTRGRFIAGLGSGMSPEDAAAFGFDILQQNDALFHDGLEALLHLWAKEVGDPPLSIEAGAHHGTLLERITPSPYRKTRPLIKTTASSPRHIDRAAREGWPVFIITRDAEGARPLFDQYRAALLSRGHGAETLAHCARWTSIAKPAMHLAETDEIAAREWAELNVGVIGFQQRKIRYDEEARRLQGITAPLPNVQQRHSAEFRKQMTVHVGVPAMIDHVREIERLGLGMFHLSLIAPADEAGFAKVERSARLFAERIIPHFRTSDGQDTPFWAAASAAESVHAEPDR